MGGLRGAAPKCQDNSEGGTVLMCGGGQVLPLPSFSSGPENQTHIRETNRRQASKFIYILCDLGALLRKGRPKPMVKRTCPNMRLHKRQLWRRDYVRRLKEGQNDFRRSVCGELSPSPLPILDDKNATFLVQGGRLPRGNFYLFFWGEESRD